MRPIDEDDVKRVIRRVKRDWMLCTSKETETALKVVEGALAGCRTIDVIQMAWEIKRYCDKQTECKHCAFNTGEYARMCVLSGNDYIAPADWELPKDGEPHDSP